MHESEQNDTTSRDTKIGTEDQIDKTQNAYIITCEDSKHHVQTLQRNRRNSLNLCRPTLEIPIGFETKCPPCEDRLLARHKINSIVARTVGAAVIIKNI